jgi:hypothetical protein
MGIMAEEKKSLLSQSFIAGKRTYYLDVKKAINGSKYLVISEISKAEDGTDRRNRLFVFQDQFDEFLKAVENIMNEAKKLE